MDYKMSINEKLIELVKQNPCLYDPKNEEYCNRIRHRKVWRKIAEQLNNTPEIIKIKWRNLRDGYFKYKNQNSGVSLSTAYKNWVWGPRLDFLDSIPRRKRKDYDKIFAEEDSNTAASDPLEISKSRTKGGRYSDDNLTEEGSNTAGSDSDFVFSKSVPKRITRNIDSDVNLAEEDNNTAACDPPLNFSNSLLKRRRTVNYDDESAVDSNTVASEADCEQPGESNMKNTTEDNAQSVSNWKLKPKKRKAVAVLKLRREMPESLKDTEREVDSSGALLAYLKNMKKNQLDAVDHLFASYAEMFKKLKPRSQTLVKLKLAQVFAEAELNDLDAETPMVIPLEFGNRNHVETIMSSEDVDEDPVILTDNVNASQSHSITIKEEVD